MQTRSTNQNQKPVFALPVYITEKVDSLSKRQKRKFLAKLTFVGSNGLDAHVVIQEPSNLSGVVIDHLDELNRVCFGQDAIQKYENNLILNWIVVQDNKFYSITPGIVNNWMRQCQRGSNAVTANVVTPDRPIKAKTRQISKKKRKADELEDSVYEPSVQQKKILTKDGAIQQWVINKRSGFTGPRINDQDDENVKNMKGQHVPPKRPPSKKKKPDVTLGTRKAHKRDLKKKNFNDLTETDKKYLRDAQKRDSITLDGVPQYHSPMDMYTKELWEKREYPKGVSSEQCWTLLAEKGGGRDSKEFWQNKFYKHCQAFRQKLPSESTSIEHEKVPYHEKVLSPNINFDEWGQDLLAYMNMTPEQREYHKLMQAKTGIALKPLSLAENIPIDPCTVPMEKWTSDLFDRYFNRSFRSDTVTAEPVLYGILKVRVMFTGWKKYLCQWTPPKDAEEAVKNQFAQWCQDHRLQVPAKQIMTWQKGVHLANNPQHWPFAKQAAKLLEKDKIPHDTEQEELKDLGKMTPDVENNWLLQPVTDKMGNMSL